MISSNSSISNDTANITSDYYNMTEYNDVEDSSLDNNLTNDSCHRSRLESSVGGNSIGHIPLRVWLTVSWILSMIILGS